MLRKKNYLIFMKIYKQKLSKKQKEIIKEFKNLSKKELIKRIMTDPDLSVNMMNAIDWLRAELHATQKILDNTKQALQSANHDLQYKEEQIKYKDRLINSLANS